MKPALAPCAALAATLLVGCASAPFNPQLAKTCLASLPNAPAGGREGVVINLLTPQTADALLDRTQANLGAAIDPAYLNNQRANVRKSDGSRATVLIPLGMAVAPGDRIAWQSAYRSPGPGCTYVPNLATRRL